MRVKIEWSGYAQFESIVEVPEPTPDDEVEDMADYASDWIAENVELSQSVTPTRQPVFPVISTRIVEADFEETAETTIL